MGANLYGQLNQASFNPGLGSGPQGPAFDLSQGLDGGPLGGGYNPGNEPFPAPSQPNFGGLPHQFQHMGPGF